MFRQHSTTANPFLHFTSKLQNLVHHWQAHRVHVRNLKEMEKAVDRLSRTAPHCLEDTGLGRKKVPASEKTSFLPLCSRS